MKLLLQSWFSSLYNAWAQDTLQFVCPQHVLVHGVIPLQVQDFTFPLVTFREGHISSLSRSL